MIIDHLKKYSLKFIKYHEYIYLNRVKRNHQQNMERNDLKHHHLVKTDA